MGDRRSGRQYALLRSAELLGAREVRLKLGRCFGDCQKPEFRPPCPSTIGETFIGGATCSYTCREDPGGKGGAVGQEIATRRSHQGLTGGLVLSRKIRSTGQIS